MRNVFKLTPKINNEMIVREKPSAIVVNARKKLLLGILERTGQENLGIKGNFPDASMFRTVLLNTGLYSSNGNSGWHYNSPDKITDEGLKEVWKKFLEFFTIPSEQPKDIKIFFEEMREPPFGVRAGLLPILFAAGIKAFQSSFSLTKSGTYVTDILPSEIENLCREPHLYRLFVPNLSKEKVEYLNTLYNCFNGSFPGAPQKTNLIQACSDAIEEWKRGLPPGAMNTRRISEETLRFRAVINQGLDPIRLLFEEIPAVCNCSIKKLDELVTIILKYKEELENIIQDYHHLAIESIRQTLSLENRNNGITVVEITRQWVNCFPEEIIKKLNNEVAKGLLSRLRMDYDSEDFLLDSISSLLVGKSLHRWDDSTITAFDREIRNAVHLIEETAFLSGEMMLDKGMATEGLTQLAKGRITELFNRLVHLVGIKEAKTIVLSALPKEIKSN